MASNNINYGNKTLNYKSLNILFEELQNIENIEKITINIVYCEKNKELEKDYSKTFNNISEFLECAKGLKKIEGIEVSFWYKNSVILLKYDYYEHCWNLRYNDENNVTNSIKYILYKHFRPNFLKKLFFQRTYILWSILWVMVMMSLIVFGDKNIYSQVGQITLGILLFIFVCLILLALYKFLKRTKPYINNKFWEEHKIDIIQNVVFYFLGVVTPYIITWVVTLINR